MSIALGMAMSMGMTTGTATFHHERVIMVVGAIMGTAIFQRGRGHGHRHDHRHGHGRHQLSSQAYD